MLIADLYSKTCASQDDDEDKDDDEVEDEDTSDKYDEENSFSVIKRVKRNQKKILAGCGLCVGVDGFSDPPEIPGMAHFLEHMIFMGSEKYLKENDFDAFIIKRGGYTNATTDCEHTTFYFDVQEKHLLLALDRFTQFFIKPLMKKDAVTRERETVENELHMFRERHYSAHRMKLAIQVRLSLDTLDKYVTKCFADLPSHGLPRDDFTVFKGGISFDTPAF
ncbi:nardilysin-like isoform x1 protein [Lasius niger]|uniref:Nardilysin-like isoform x1 protein n=1 Tax=Lasius niger TaxID=67767 RepID=A0A0J7JZ18_LASNI|nr:nardilysin-like isoform x1 protein [Lasius niger]